MRTWGSSSTRLIFAVCLGLAAVSLLGCARPEITTAVNDIAISSAPLPESTPTQDRNLINTEVNGIRQGSSYEDLKKNFGKPLSEKRGGENACGSDKTVVKYKGITFTLDNDGKRHFVVFIEITSPEWEMPPGVKVGMTLEQVRSKISREGKLYTEDEVETLGYADGDGYLTFQFTSGKVAKITRELNLC